MTTTSTTTPKPLRRWLQFSLRSMLIVATLVALATHAGRQWWVTRLVYLVEKQDCFIDEQRYAEAEAVAELAWLLYPDHPAARHMVQLSRSCRLFENLTGGVEPSQPNDGCTVGLAFGGASTWEGLSSQRWPTAQAVDNTPVTDAGVDQLKKALPNLTIQQ